MRRIEKARKFVPFAQSFAALFLPQKMTDTKTSSTLSVVRSGSSFLHLLKISAQGSGRLYKLK